MNLHRIQIPIIALVCAGLFLSGCKGEDPIAVRVQTVPKQPKFLQTQAPMGGMGMQLPSEVPANPGVQWTVPDGWKQLASDPQQMRFATFQVSDAKPEVVLTVIPLGKEGGALLPNVNRWEQQLSLPPTKEADLGKVVTRIEVAGVAADTVNLLGPEAANPRMQMLAAIMLGGDRAWFFKLAGPASVVGPQKDKFEQFIKSVRFGGDAAIPQPPAAGAAGAAGGNPPLPDGHPVLPGQQPPLPDGHPALPGAGAAPGAAPGAAQLPAPPPPQVTLKYATPEGWVKDAPVMFRVVSFHIGQGEQQVDMLVSSLPAATSGSYQDNVNRWRGQVGLEALKQGEPQASEPVIVGGLDGAMFDLVGPGEKARARRMMLAWIPRGGEWWFFKLVGPDELVAREKPSFEKFLKSIEFVGAKP